ncbi:MAG: type I-G CRISPR-associated helicase/endonuclease Cas3g [Bryobacteraceae bacterium]
MYKLPPGDFPKWFQALNQTAPFPWQARLFKMLCPEQWDEGRWPRSIGLPTASGKTSLVDLAVLALACGSKCARRRVVFVVDRRIVVDEAARRAERIAATLRAAVRDRSSPLHEVAERLVETGGDPDEPLLVARLRGGIQFDDAWARNPAQPAVILSTVDQAGSRLLFRAYGPCSPKSWPILAGLMGVDTLFVIDEAHCVRPFCETLEAIQSRWQCFAEEHVLPEISVVELSATLGGAPEFTLDDVDDLACPVLAKRLKTPKPVNLISVPTEGEDRLPLEKRCVEEAEAWFKHHKTGVLAIVVNRVGSARRIFEALPLPEGQKLLLTGRARSWERDALIRSWLPQLQSGRGAVTNQYAVVATQCVEVGADFDFDYLISEAASLDALRQRFGRLDRLGQRHQRLGGSDAGEPAGCLIALESQVELDGQERVKSPDPVYGSSLALTWRLLKQAANSRGQVDFSHFGLEPLQDRIEDPDGLLQPTRCSFPLLPAYLDLLAQTSPPPEPDVEISAFLHGTTSPSADVMVVWRAGLDPERPELWGDLVSIQPPLPGEACAVPVWEARGWLEGPEATPEKAHDLEEPGDEESEQSGGAPKERRLALAWRGPEDSVLRRPEEIRPGDLLVVPSQFGGCTRYGWDPSSKEEVLDIGDAVAVALGRRPVLRIATLTQYAKRLANPDPISALAETMAGIPGDEALEPAEQAGLVKEALEQLREAAGPESELNWLRKLADGLLSDPRIELEIWESDGEPRLVAVVGSRGAMEERQSAGDTTQFRRTAPVKLTDHLKGVEQTVSEFVERLGLGPLLRESLMAAARLHDLGKWDPRFQAWLRGIALFAPTGPDEILAKSTVISPRNLVSIRRGRALAGYPDGARHEALSAALAERALSDPQNSVDLDLALHLIASHHGYARPWFPVPATAEAIPLQVDFGDRKLEADVDYQALQTDEECVDRFWRLVRRYGWWGLAYLEAILRLADQRRSENEERNDRN